MNPNRLKWIAFEMGLLLITAILLVSRASVATEFEVNYDGMLLAVLAFSLGMLVRELFI